MKPDEADERALDIGALVEEWVADHKSGEGLGITGLNWIEMTRFAAVNLTGLPHGLNLRAHLHGFLCRQI